jgi:hypothetical protein
MKRLTVLITLIIVTGSLSAGCLTLPLAAAAPSIWPGSLDPRALDRNQEVASRHIPPIDTASPSCASPTPGEIEECQRLEQQILASTVRLEWHLWNMMDDGNGYITGKGGVGYATIKEGRYLVTHNHSEILRSDLKNGSFITVSVFSADGEPIWLEAPLSLISIVVEETETLVIDFGNYTGQGPFAIPGLTSAEFKAWEMIPLQPGMEVAQIDWDGAMASVNWVIVENVITERGTPILELANFTAEGTSGGGIFWNGYHIANTWYQATNLDRKTRTVLRRYSVAALNSPQVVRSRGNWCSL